MRTNLKLGVAFIRAKKRYFLGGAAVLILALLAGGFLYWKDVLSPLSLPRTAQGLAFEELLPEESTLTFVFRPTDEAQWNNFKKLWTAVLQDKSEAAPVYIARQLVEKGDIKLSIEKFQKLFSEDFSVAFSIALESEKEEKPEIYMLLSTANPSEAQSLLENLAEQEDKILRDEEGLLFVQQGSDTGVFYGIVGDVVFLAKAPEERVEKLLSRKSSARGSISRNSDFRRFAEKLSETGIGYVFGNSRNNQNFFPSVKLGEIPDDFATASFSLLRAQEDGLMLETTAFKPDHATSSAEEIFKPYVASLYKSLPAEGVIMFSEGSRLGPILQLNMQMLARKGDKNDADFFKELKDSSGFDFESDLAPFLDRGFAFAWHDSGTLFPGLTFLIDASGAPEKAATVVDRLAEKVPGWIALGNIVFKLKSAKDAPIFSHKKFSKIPQGGIAVINFHNIPEEDVNIPVFNFFTEPVEISYGITADNKLFFSTLSNFEQILAAEKPIQNHPLFKEMENLGIGAGAFAFIDGETFGNFFSRIVAVLGKEEKMSEKELEGYAFLQKHLSPIQGFIQVSQGDGEKIHGKGLLKIVVP